MLKLRRAVQVVSLLFFIALLIVAALPGERLIRVVDIYPRMSPLMFISTWLNAWKFSIAFLPAIVVIAATLVFGRFFCGWVCPLGVTLDATDKMIGPRKRNDANEPLRWKPVKYALLIIVLIAAYFEANIAGWLDPLSFATKLYTLALLPAFEFGTKIILKGLSPLPGIGFVADNLYSFSRTTIYATDQTKYHGMAAVLLIYLAVALLVYFNRRFWCRFLCPAGAVFALLSRFSIYRRSVDADKCIKCGKCERTCRMGAITGKGLDGFRGECIECFTCKSVCPVKAVSFRPFAGGSDVQPVNFGRRGFLASVGGAAVAIPIVRLAPGVAGTALVRPPGVPSEDFFMQTCLRCGECMRVCPTNGLQPVWLESGLEGLWTPRLEPRTGNCEFTCSKCGQVCPSNAIAELAPGVKQKTVLGRAVFDHNRCIPWSRGENCGVCEEQCPVADKAIRFREADFIDDIGNPVKVFQPYIVEQICIGCGTCEKVCPVEGAAGVTVTGVKQHIIEVKGGVKNAGGKAAQPPLTPAAATPAVAAKQLPAATGTPQLEVKQVTAPPLPDGRLPIQLKPLLPDDMKAWKPEGALKAAIPSTLYDLIDGGAEVYLEYGFVKALRQDYARGDSFLTIDIYFMKDETAAFGIYSAEHGPGEASAGMGRGSAVNDYEIKFWQDKYYVKVTGDTTRVEYVKIAKAISAAIAAPGGKVAPADWRAPGFPNAEKDSLLIVRGPLALKRILYFTDKDIFGFAKGAVGAAYSIKGAGTAVVLKPGKALNAQAMSANLVSALREKGFADAPASGLPAGYTALKRGGSLAAYKVSNGNLNLYIESKEEEE